MNKILLIIQREYFSRVKKKSFLLLTFLVPFILLGMNALVVYLSVKGGDRKTNISVIDESGIFIPGLKDNKSVDFTASTQPLPEAKKKASGESGEFLLYIPADIRDGGTPELFSQKKPGIAVIEGIEDQMNAILRTRMLEDAGIDLQTLNSIKPDISIMSKELTAEGEKDSSAGAAYAVGFVSAILIYMSLFIYGAQVMRGIIEEKTSRIIEVIVSSVKPFQLMLGKIIGIGMVGLTQFLLWIILSLALTGIAGSAFIKDNNINRTEQVMNKDTPGKVQREGLGGQVMNAVGTINIPYVLTCFLIYFLGGFLLYSALFAAVGSAVDSETETQQFMFPITLPLLFTYIMSFSFIVNNPDSTLAFWMSLIPFTSPIAMMVRLPFGVPDWQLFLSIGLLVCGFMFTTWVAARIYRVGILMYGKKASYRELAKWFMYKE